MKKKCTLLLLAAMLCWPAVSLFAQSQLSMYFVGTDGTQVRQLEATIGEDFIEPRLVIEPAGADVRVVYSSTNPNVAEVDMMSGEVTLLKAGNTTIMAQSGQTEQYYSARATYNLIVNEQETPPDPEFTCPDAKYYFNGGELTVMTLKVGDVVSIPVLLGATGEVYSLRAKTVEGIRVAELTADDMIHAVGAGTARFVGLIIQTVQNQAGTVTTQECEYSFDIVVESAVTEKADPELSFSQTEVDIELGEKWSQPELINPHNVPTTQPFGKYYTNWDSQVAQVDEGTGEVTILGVGDETIYFEFTGNAAYKPALISYTIHVSTLGLVIGGVAVTNSNKEDVFGDQGSIVYDPLTHTLTMTNATVSGASIDLAPARVKAAAKTEELPAAGILYGDKMPLTIVLIGGNAIFNADAAIYSIYAPVVMMSPEGAFGSIRINGSTVGVKAEALKLFKCAMLANGGAAAVAVNELAVATGANLLAQGQAMAIQANSLVLAEDNDGEGIAILTEGVTFEKGKGFMKDGKVARVVEIGKVVIPVPDDEVTTIDFSVTDPDGNESLIFSSTANDTYNAETGQLEISSTLTDEQVEYTMETFVPGSSEWKANLPGAIMFDIPAGEGEIEIEGSVSYGYTLKLKLDGQPVAVLTKGESGAIVFQYNTPVSLHVVLYLQIDNSASMPSRVAAGKADEEPTTGATISSIKITPKNAPQGLEDVTKDQSQTTNKVIVGAQILILRGGKAYTPQGQEVK